MLFFLGHAAIILLDVVKLRIVVVVGLHVIIHLPVVLIKLIVVPRYICFQLSLRGVILRCFLLSFLSPFVGIGAVLP